MMWLKDAVRVDRVMNAVAAGTTDQNSATVDMQAAEGFDEATFVAAFGTLTATQVTKIKAQESDDDSVWNDSKDSESAAMADADSNKLLAVTVRPKARYVRCVVDRGTANAVIDGVFAFLSKARKQPVTQSADVVGWETHDYKSTGTA